MNSSISTSFKTPRLLVISHNCFSDVNNNGKTLSTFVEGWGEDSIAQLYFHDEIPTSNVCSNYFKITETLIIKSIFSKQRSGVEIRSNQSNCSPITKTKSSLTNLIYSLGSRKLWTLNILRDLFWTFTKCIWYNPSLIYWIKKLNPECILLGPGDSTFIYKITYKIAKTFNIPVIIYYGDDYLIYYKAQSISGYFQQFLLRQNAKKVFLLPNKVLTISKELAEEYRRTFKINAEILMKGTKLNNTRDTLSNFNHTDKIKFLYLGGLGLNRWKSLVDLGKYLKIYNDQTNSSHYIDIFSTSSISKEIEKEINNAMTINIKGSLTALEAENILNEYDILIHVEDLSKKYSSRTMYSISTKIPEYLASGKIILAYGPAEVASINYLKQNNAAIIINEPSEIFNSLIYFLNDESQRLIISNNAIALANKNHNPKKIKEHFRKLTTQDYMQKNNSQNKNNINVHL